MLPARSLSDGEHWASFEQTAPRDARPSSRRPGPCSSVVRPRMQVVSRHVLRGVGGSCSAGSKSPALLRDGALKSRSWRRGALRTGCGCSARSCRCASAGMVSFAGVRQTCVSVDRGAQVGLPGSCPAGLCSGLGAACAVDAPAAAVRDAPGPLHVQVVQPHRCHMAGDRAPTDRNPVSIQFAVGCRTAQRSGQPARRPRIAPSD